MKLVLLTLTVGFALFAYEIKGVRVEGEKEALIVFDGLPAQSAPSVKVSGNIVDIGFPGATLSETLQQKVDLESPHAIIQRVSVYESAKGFVRAKIVLQGSTEHLSERVQFVESRGTLNLKIDYPSGSTEALHLLQEEQKPVLAKAPAQKKDVPMISTTQVVLTLMVILLAGAASFFAVRVLKNKGAIRGSRKFLIEQLAHCSLGGKSGVSLLKINTEFVLVGVTPQNVTLLSTLPKLEQKYEEDSQFERGVFKEAFNEEFQRLKTSDANA